MSRIKDKIQNRLIALLLNASKVTLIVYEMRVSMARDGFGPILSQKFRVPSVWSDKMFNFTKPFLNETV